MILRIIVTALVMSFCWFGVVPTNVRGAGPRLFFCLKEIVMSDSKKGQGPTPNPGGGKTRSIVIPLRDLPDPAKTEDEYSHRFRQKYSKAELSEMVENLRQEKQIYTAVQVFKDKDGKWVVLAGHRRLAAVYLLSPMREALHKRKASGRVSLLR